MILVITFLTLLFIANNEVIIFSSSLPVNAINASASWRFSDKSNSWSVPSPLITIASGNVSFNSIHLFILDSIILDVTPNLSIILTK